MIECLQLALHAGCPRGCPACAVCPSELRRATSGLSDNWANIIINHPTW